MKENKIRMPSKQNTVVAQQRILFPVKNKHRAIARNSNALQTLSGAAEQTLVGGWGPSLLLELLTELRVRLLCCGREQSTRTSTRSFFLGGEGSSDEQSLILRLVGGVSEWDYSHPRARLTTQGAERSG